MVSCVNKELKALKTKIDAFESDEILNIKKLINSKEHRRIVDSLRYKVFFKKVIKAIKLNSIGYEIEATKCTLKSMNDGLVRFYWFLVEENDIFTKIDDYIAFSIREKLRIITHRQEFAKNQVPEIYSLPINLKLTICIYFSIFFELNSS